MDKSVYIETYGCQMNVADSELMAGLLSRAGFVLADDILAADVILVNTCAIREHAEERVLGRMAHFNRYKLKNPNLILGICGCMSKHLGKKLFERAPYIDLVVGPDSYRRLPEMIRELTGDPFLDLRLDKKENYLGITPLREKKTNAWVTIMRGCDKFCTFCVVPYVRGREKNVPAHEIVDQVEELAAEGYKSVTLLGQTVNSYQDGSNDFADLLEMVSQVDGIERIRFTSPHPSDFSQKLLDTMSDNVKICKHIHLPVQSGSNQVLERMKRSYKIEEYLSLVDKIREGMPGVGLSTDIIVGFPGETQEDYQATYRLMETVCYDSAFSFKYSPREGTAAYRKIHDDVPEKEKARRVSDIIALQEKISLEINQALLGEEVEVLVEGKSKKGVDQLFGKTDNFKTAVFPYSDDIKANTFVKLKVVGVTSHTLFGEVILHGSGAEESTVIENELQETVL